MAYKAFLSYSHVDEAQVRWFHRQLEGWKVPRKLVGRETAVGAVPRTLRPIFRDRDDFAGGASLKKATREALDGSEFLVVFCSPASARSEFVNEEILAFKATGRSDRVISVILDGEPGDPERECFPEALRHRVGPEGQVLAERANPLAADAREIGDGRKRALAKVVAGLLGVPFDEIIHRAERARRNRLALLAGVLVGAFVFATGFAAYALHQSNKAKVAIDKSVFALGGLIQEADKLEDGDVETSRAEMLRALCDLMEGLAEDPERIGVLEKTVCYCEQADAIHEIGETERALAGLSERFTELHEAFREAEKPTLEQASAVVRAARALALIRLGSLDADADPAPPLLDLVSVAAEVGERRPDAVYVRDVHEEALWPLLEALEGQERWREVVDLMRRAASVRDVQARGGTSADGMARLERGVYLRRSAWVLAAHLDDHAQALELARAAVDQLVNLFAERNGIEELVDARTLRYQRIVAHQVLAQELATAEETEPAREQFSRALELAHKHRASLEDDDESIPEIDGMVEYLGGRVQELER